jgi:hypothetical protein
MAHESFSDEKTAEILNEHFVSIKVDREERPDVDAVYMQAVQMMTGSGGWPLSVFLTPEGKPFYGGTYYPPEDSYGRPGFSNVLLGIANAWQNREKEVRESAEKMTGFLQTADQVQAPGAVTEQVLENAAEYLARSFDAKNGGFGSAPKFPQPSNLSLLMRYWRRTGKEDVLKMVRATLDAMANGGIHDQLAGGFHRYSVDAVWLAPHFEKMLYDQALLVRAYLEAYQITGDESYAGIARDVLGYVLRDMTDKEGGFYSAEDADSEGEEGRFYVWTPAEIRELLKGKEEDIFIERFGLTEAGNFDGGRTILSVKTSIESLAEKHKVDEAKVRSLLESAGRKVLAARNKRIRPGRDEKIIAGWNGLMISSFAMAGRVLDEPEYTKAAQRCAGFVLEKLIMDGRLMRSYINGQTEVPGFLDDYAFVLAGLCDLYEADYSAPWLKEANVLADEMIRLFFDNNDGVFYLTGMDSERLIVRTKPAYDGAIPNGNSVAVWALIRLGQFSGEESYGRTAERVLKTFSKQLTESGASLTEMLIAADMYVGPRQEIVVAGKRGSSDTKAMLHEIGKRFLPAAIRMFHEEGPDGAEIEKVAEFIGPQRMVGGQATAYVCEDYVCKSPINTIGKLQAVLEELERSFPETHDAANRTVDK